MSKKANISLRQFLMMKRPDKVRTVYNYVNQLVEDGSLKREAYALVADKYVLDVRTVQRIYAEGRKK